MNYRIIRIFITLLFLIIFPLSVVAAQQSSGKHLVIIDPSHGGSDLGVRLSDKENEKNTVLAISLALKRELDKTGNIRTQLTRTSDREVSVAERKKAATASRGEVFISIHVNAGFGKNATGYEVYFPGFRETITEQGDSKDILKDMVRNKYLNNSVRLAQLIQKNLDSVLPRKSRGIRDASVPVLEGLLIPAIVVEVGFATNPEDRKKMLDANTQDAIARALCQGIKDFF